MSLLCCRARKLCLFRLSTLGTHSIKSLYLRRHTHLGRFFIIKNLSEGLTGFFFIRTCVLCCCCCFLVCIINQFHWRAEKEWTFSIATLKKKKISWRILSFIVIRIYPLGWLFNIRGHPHYPPNRISLPFTGCPLAAPLFVFRNRRGIVLVIIIFILLCITYVFRKTRWVRIPLHAPPSISPLCNFRSPWVPWWTCPAIWNVIVCVCVCCTVVQTARA